MAKSVPDETVPDEDQTQDQNAVVSVKKQVTQRQYDHVKRAGGDVSQYEVVEPDDLMGEDTQETVPENDEPAPAQDGEGEPEDDGEPEAQEEPSETVPEDSTPEGETEDQIDEEGYSYGDFGGRAYRKDKDGIVYWETKIGGETEYVKSEAYHKGFQLNTYNQRKAQELAEREKAIEQRESFNSTIKRFLPDKQEPRSDDFEDGDFSPGEKPAAPATSEVAELRKEIADLKAGMTESDEVAAYRERVGLQISHAWESAEKYCEKMGVPVPVDKNNAEPDKALMARAQAVAENKGITYEQVMTDPNELSEIFLSMSRKKPTGPATPSANGIPKPPSAAAPSQKTQGKGRTSELQRAEDRLDALRKKQKDGEVKNQRTHDAALIKANREISRLKSKG